jgi:hypothetical protein
MEGDMKLRQTILAAAGFIILTHGGAEAAALTVINVGAPKINCVFNATCTVVVNNSIGNLTYSTLGGSARLQTRTYQGQPNTPGAGAVAYEYRLDLTQGDKYRDCIGGLVVNFGPVLKLPYGANNAQGHVFVVTQGGLGSVGIKSAIQDGNVITFTFDTFLCAGQTTYFFGLAANKAPVNASATMFAIGATPFIAAGARVPQH